MKILMKVFYATATAAAALLTGKATYHYHSISKKFMDSVDDTISIPTEPRDKKWRFQAKLTEVVQERVNSNPTNIKVGATIDGGGVRGIVPLFILYEMQQRAINSIKSTKGENFFEDNPPMKINDGLDIIAGTSVGGIIGLALGTKISRLNEPENLVQNFLKDKDRMFSPVYNGFFPGPTQPSMFECMVLSCFKKLPQDWLLSDDKVRVCTIPKLFWHCSLYDNESKQKLLKEYFSENSKTLMFSDLKITVLTTSTNMLDNQPYTFGATNLEDTPLWAAAHITSNAPYYFKPSRISTHNPKKPESKSTFFLIDGGLIANNPVLLVYRYLNDFYKQSENKLILSFGCGSINIQNNITAKHILNYVVANTFSRNALSSNSIDRHLIGFPENRKKIDIFRFDPYYTGIKNGFLKKIINKVEVEKIKDQNVLLAYDQLVFTFGESYLKFMTENEPSMVLDDTSKANLKLLAAYSVAFIMNRDYQSKAYWNYSSRINIVAELFASKYIEHLKNLGINHEDHAARNPEDLFPDRPYACALFKQLFPTNDCMDEGEIIEIEAENKQQTITPC